MQLNHEDGLAEGLFVLGRSAQGQNDLATARTYYLDALKLCKQHHLEANALEGLELWAAYLLAVAEKEEAASLLAFIAAQSSASHAARAKAQAHLQVLATVLDPQQIAAAHEKARTMTLAAVLDNVLAHH